MTIAPGLYRHYKGNTYRVVGAATHTETEEPLVLYHPVADDSRLWARPTAMFAEDIEFNGETQPRFRRLEE